jgi:exopolysaccharide biosynthesis protein
MANGLNMLRAMTVRRLFLIAVLIASAARADWRSVAPGVDYQEFRAEKYDIHVTRINIASDQIRIVVSNETDKGLKVSDYAKKVNAIAAINGDYFDDHFNPVGFTIGPCGPWTNVKDMKREIVLEVANQKILLRKRAELGDSAPETVDAAISGWPFIVAECKALGPTELPGSDAFTRAPHPRTALGISNDGTLLYFVVADGRRTGIPGLTLAELASFMADKLDVCSAMNLDGGGSTAMWVGDKIVNRPSDGVERGVGDHIAVILRRDYNGCPPSPQKTSSSTQR